MPRYLGKDYLADALQHRKNMLSQMLLTIPSHLEYVDTYTHNGTVENKIRYIPWRKETAFKLSSKQPIDYLSQITDTTSSIHHPEPYSPEKTGDEYIVPSSNPDSPLVSFDLWSDLEEEIVNYVINSLAPDKEQFTPSNEKDNDDPAMQDKLEEMEYTDYLHAIRQKIPKIRDLSSRLKTKLVQDPLVLDSQGNPLTEESVLRIDHQAPFDGESNKRQRHTDKEMFFKVLSSDDVNENDFTVEDKEIEVVVSPVIPSKQSLCVEETQRLLKLHENSEPEDNEPSACNLLEDQQLLESPSHLPIVPVNDDNSKKFISSLETFKQSSEINSPPLTPSKIKQCVQNIWENEKLLFSEHLAMVFPVPSTSSGRKKSSSLSLVQVAIKKLILPQECLDGNLELGIPWDPLAVSTSQMENCQKNLQSLTSWSRGKAEQGERLAQQKALSYSKETFHKTNIHDDEAGGVLTRGVTSSDSQVKRLQTPTTIDNQITLPVTLSISKSPANLITRSSSPSRIVTQNGTNFSKDKDQQEPCFAKRTTLSAFKQASGGIEDFFLLREGQLDSLKPSTQAQCTPTKKVVKAAKVRPSVFATEASGTTETNPTKQTTVPECQEQAITVELSSEFQEVLQELIGHVKPLLFRLQGNGVILQNKTLSNLNPEYTRFVLKQAQMSVKEGEEKTAWKIRIIV
ncbi:hypothetical protein OS493_022218 [Desmophyllum pertusum]|uniref:Uncharacterized protein n=1 Tax=Desmophyllum pertusum TaxID=174260 RepID=A0A9W9YE80_9CNID|nr:hypothetical protein OS493_022218 [Desmophyllum pertusum]